MWNKRSRVTIQKKKNNRKSGIHHTGRELSEVDNLEKRVSVEWLLQDVRRYWTWWQHPGPLNDQLGTHRCPWSHLLTAKVCLSISVCLECFFQCEASFPCALLMMNPIPADLFPICLFEQTELVGGDELLYHHRSSSRSKAYVSLKCLWPHKYWGSLKVAAPKQFYHQAGNEMIVSVWLLAHWRHLCNEMVGCCFLSSFS